MLQRLICECGELLKSPTQYCLSCGRRYSLGSGIYVSKDRAQVFLVGRHGNEFLTFERYEDEISLRNLYEVIAEKVYERRIEEIYVSGESHDLIYEAVDLLKSFLYPFAISATDVFENSYEFFARLEKTLRTKSDLRTVDLLPEEKIQGSHSTIIGGRDGYALVMRLAKSPYVKKVVPGVIEGNATSVGGGVRLKLTRSDDRGNLRALLIDGATVQQIHVITTAATREEGETILKILSGDVRDL
ncbi:MULTISPECIES: DUF2103 domain-containing protein [unclassified Archaeoglobus]|jgi:hypothetical protein|uniref:DUF2103 domain-containing protein n=1 Tax=unclassified Archaeoglobus TaxID=2643606 RepID=UPI0025BBD07C|nr:MULTISPECIES: DUF2103 domain-containing protein [unclassified Archaeoglobus]